MQDWKLWTARNSFLADADDVCRCYVDYSTARGIYKSDSIAGPLFSLLFALGAKNNCGAKLHTTVVLRDIMVLFHNLPTWAVLLLQASTLVCGSNNNGGNGGLYKDPSQPVTARVEDLLSKMTVEDKMAQLMQGSLVE